MLPGLLIFLLLFVTLILVYGFWKKKHMGSEYSHPPSFLRAEYWGSTHSVPRRYVLTCVQPQGLLGTQAREEGGWKVGRQEQHGMTLRGQPGRKERVEPEEGTDWPRIMGGGESRSPAPLQLCPCPPRLQGVQ